MGSCAQPTRPLKVISTMSYPFLSAFPFDDPEPPHSLSDYAPVFRVRDRQGEWVAKQTDRAHSSGIAIGAWARGLASRGS